MLNVGLVGYGYWGPNIARNLKKTDFNFKAIIEENHIKHKDISIAYPNIKIYNNIYNKELLNSIDAVIIATPIESHYKIAKFFLQNNKHVLIQKPICDSIYKTLELIDLAEKYKCKLMTAHTFLFSPAIQKIKKDIDNNIYGNIDYLISTRLNLGLFQRNHNVIWDLAPHDFSIIRYLYNESPKYISAIGSSHTNSNHIDCAYISILYNSNVIINININWLSPIKIRNMILGCKNKTVLYDDLDINKIKIYDSSVEYDNDVFTYRKGDIYIPKISDEEPIFFECQEFFKCIIEDRKPISDGEFSLEVIKMIEATNKSIINNGMPICL